MGIPDHLIPADQKELVRVRPATSANGYNDVVRDYGQAAARATFAGWIQQDKREQPPGSDGRDLTAQRLLLLTNYTDIAEFDRIEWAANPLGAVTYELDGPPEPVHTPAGFHHLEATLRKIAG